MALNFNHTFSPDFKSQYFLQDQLSGCVLPCRYILYYYLFTFPSWDTHKI